MFAIIEIQHLLFVGVWLDFLRLALAGILLRADFGFLLIAEAVAYWFQAGFLMPAASTSRITIEPGKRGGGLKQSDDQEIWDWATA